MVEAVGIRTGNEHTHLLSKSPGAMFSTSGASFAPNSPTSPIHLKMLFSSSCNEGESGGRTRCTYILTIFTRRVPRYSVTTLTEWYKDLIPAHTARVFSYFVERTATVIDLIDEVDVITKNAYENRRLIQFHLLLIQSFLGNSLVCLALTSSPF